MYSEVCKLPSLNNISPKLALTMNFYMNPEMQLFVEKTLMRILRLKMLDIFSIPEEHHESRKELRILQGNKLRPIEFIECHIPHTNITEPKVPSMLL